MTPEQIRTTVQGDATLRAYANAGNDAAIAAEITELVASGKNVNYNTLCSLFKGKVALNLLNRLRAKTGVSAPVGKEYFTILYDCLMNETGILGFELLEGNPDMMTDLLNEGILENTNQRNTLRDFVRQARPLTVNEVSDALAIWRPGGIITPIP